MSELKLRSNGAKWAARGLSRARRLSAAAILPALLWGAHSSGVAGGLAKAEKILSRAEEIRNPGLDYSVELGLKIIDGKTYWKERTAAYTLIAHGKDYSLIMMREPRTFYSGTLLIDRGLYWLLLPRSEKAIQLAARQVLSGDIANGDLARGNLVEHYDVRLDGEEVVREEACWRLELTRAQDVAMYKRIRVWITKKDFRPWKFEYYGETDALTKVATYEDYRETALGVRSMRIVVENSLRPSEKTILTFSDLRRIDASGIDFSREGMPAFRDVALRLKRGSIQPKTEDLLRALTADETDKGSDRTQGTSDAPQ